MGSKSAAVDVDESVPESAESGVQAIQPRTVSPAWLTLVRVSPKNADVNDDEIDASIERVSRGRTFVDHDDLMAEARSTRQ